MWSPDSKNLIYGEGFGPIHVFSADGSNQTLLTNAALPTWSPSGEKIAFAYYNNTYYQIYAMDIKSTNKTLLTTSTSPVSSLAWSPDGRNIAFASSIESGYEIYIMNADGSNERKLTSYKLYPGLPDSLWSPDSSSIAFIFSEEAKFGIGIVNADGTNQTLIAGGWSPAWCPYSTKIAFESEGKIYLVNADGSNKTQLGEGYAPIWSADGKKIAFERDRDGNNAIYVMNADGSDQKKLADGWAPAWSPRGGNRMQLQNLDLVWSCIAAIGSLLLATSRELKGKALIGVWLIFTAFVIHALFDSYSIGKWWGPTGVLLFVVIALLLGLRKSIFKRRKIA